MYLLIHPTYLQLQRTTCESSEIIRRICSPGPVCGVGARSSRHYLCPLSICGPPVVSPLTTCPHTSHMVPVHMRTSSPPTPTPAQRRTVVTDTWTTAFALRIHPQPIFWALGLQTNAGPVHHHHLGGGRVAAVPLLQAGDGVGAGARDPGLDLLPLPGHPRPRRGDPGQGVRAAGAGPGQPAQHSTVPNNV